MELLRKANVSLIGALAFFVPSSKPRVVDPEQILTARLKCDLHSALTPSPLAVVVVGELLGRGSQIGEQAAQRYGACTSH
jgi:hypothetical protein